MHNTNKGFRTQRSDRPFKNGNRDTEDMFDRFDKMVVAMSHYVNAAEDFKSELADSLDKIANQKDEGILKERDLEAIRKELKEEIRSEFSDQISELKELLVNLTAGIKSGKGSVRTQNEESVAKIREDLEEASKSRENEVGENHSESDLRIEDIKGLGPVKIEKLKKGGITKLEQIANPNPNERAVLMQFGNGEKIIDHAKMLLKSFGDSKSEDNKKESKKDVDKQTKAASRSEQSERRIKRKSADKRISMIKGLGRRKIMVLEAKGITELDQYANPSEKDLEALKTFNNYESIIKSAKDVAIRFKEKLK